MKKKLLLLFILCCSLLFVGCNQEQKKAECLEKAKVSFDEIYALDMADGKLKDEVEVSLEELGYSYDSTEVSIKWEVEDENNYVFSYTDLKNDITWSYLCENGENQWMEGKVIDCEHEAESVAAVPATCTKPGLTAGTICSKCNKRLSGLTVIEAKGHTEVIDAAVEATCSATGLTEGKHCETCNEVLVKQEVVAKAEHTKVVDKAVEATCTKDGLTEGLHCSACNEVLVKQEVVKAKGHTEVVDKAKEATCTEPGLTEGKHCSVCNEVLVKQEEVKAKGHDFGEWTVVKEATETEEGLKERVCKRTGCSEKEQTTVPTLSHVHNYSSVVTAPTCTEEGYTTYTCKCGETYKDNKVNALGHTEVVDKAVAATCTEAGKTEGKHCSVCNTVLVAQTAVAAKGHTEVVDAAKEATCAETGLTEGKHCSVCNTVLVAQTEVAAKGHDFGEWKVVTNATETKEGLKERTCKRTGCSEKQQATIPVLDHTHSYAQEVTLPTCTSVGYTTYICTCGDSFISNTVDKLPHTEVVDKAVASTCTATGLTEGKHCSVCNTTLVAQNTVEKLPHTEVVDKAVAATCTEAGKTEGKHCSVCNTVLVAQTTVAAKGHTEVVDKAVAATCTETGLTEGKHCSVCNTTLVAQTTVPATGHTEVVDKAVASTCTETGLTEGKHCSVCTKVLVAQEVVPATGHTEVIDKAVASTCTESGKTEGKHCSVCNTVLVAQTTVPAKGHDYEGVVTTASSCTAEGVKTYTCKNDASHTYTEPVEKLPHTEVVLEAVAPTFTTTGLTEGKKCSVCTADLVKQEVIPMLEKNVFTVDYVNNGDGTIKVTISISGDAVKYTGFDAELSFDTSKLTFVSGEYVANGMGEINETDGVITMTCAGSKDNTNATVLYEMTFNCTTPIDTKLQLVITDIFDQDFETQDYVVKGGNININ